jgi:hypothetical protein
LVNGTLQWQGVFSFSTHQSTMKTGFGKCSAYSGHTLVVAKVVGYRKYYSFHGFQ